MGKLTLGFLIDLTEKLAKNGAGFESLAHDIETTMASGKLFFHIVAAVAEFERSLISERTKAGIQSARRRGKHIGRPHRLRPDQLQHAAWMIRSGEGKPLPAWRRCLG